MADLPAAVVQVRDIGVRLPAVAPRAVLIGRQQPEAVAQASRRASRHGAEDVEIAKERRSLRRRDRGIGCRALRFLVEAEDQSRIREHEVAHRGGAADVRLVEPADLAGGQRARGESDRGPCWRHAFAEA